MKKCIIAILIALALSLPPQPAREQTPIAVKHHSSIETEDHYIRRRGDEIQEDCIKFEIVTACQELMQ